MIEVEKMTSPVGIVLAGIGGYGNLYLEKLLEEGEKLNARLVGVVDPNPEICPNYKKLLEKQIPIFSSIEDFYEYHRADLAILSTPIHLHAPQTCYALNQGSHVLCEKPMSSSIDEVKAMIETRDRTGKFVAIGYNWSFTEPIQEMKNDILQGKYGKPLRMKAVVNWPRNKAYFERNDWAGRKFSDDGKPIFDSVVSNATAHYLHHMFYMLGPTTEESVEVKEVTAELYRANPIENFDTCAVKVKVAGDVEIFYFATHAVKESVGPQYVLEFEKASIVYENHRFIARFHDGTEYIYANPNINQLEKLNVCIQAIREGTKDILCGPEAAFPHVQTIVAMNESVPEIVQFPKTMIHVDEESEVTWVEGLMEAWLQCYEQWSLPSELNIPWAKKGKTIVI